MWCLRLAALAALGVAAAADWCVAPDGDDAHPGTPERPFATLARARDAVRAALAQNPARNLMVELRDGAHVLREPLVLGPEDTPAAGFQVSWQAAPGAQPVLRGSVALTGWTRYEDPARLLPQAAQGQVWVAPIPDGAVDCRVLFDDAGFLPRAATARLEPDLSIIVPKKTYAELRLKPGQVPEQADLSQAELSLVPMMWIHNLLPIAAWDPASGTMRLASQFAYMTSRWHLAKQIGEWGCRLENVLWALDKPGEWVVDPARRCVYVWPRQGEPQGIRFPMTRELIRVAGVADHQGDADRPAGRQRFAGLTFSETDRLRRPEDIQHRSIINQWEVWDGDNAALRLRVATDCVVEACVFQRVGDLAIRCDLYARNHRIQNNWIHHTGGSGILLCGYGLGLKDVNRQHTIADNLIEDIGAITRASMGLILWQSGSNVVLHNTIRRTGYTGIAVMGRASWEASYWPWEPATTRADEVRQALVTAANPRGMSPQLLALQTPSLLHTRENRLERNVVEATCLVSGDGNGIYIAGAGSGNVVAENLVRQTNEPLRCDDDQHGTTLRDNVVIDGGMACNKGENTWTGNIFYAVNGFSRWMYVMIGRIPQEERWKRAVFERNALVCRIWKGDAFLVDERRRQGFEQNTVRSNLYWPAREVEQAQAYVAAAQRERGHEQGSLVADPQFRDPAKLDFRTTQGSPAHAIGIVGVDVSGNGPRAGFPFAAAWRGAAERANERQ